MGRSIKMIEGPLTQHGTLLSLYEALGSGAPMHCKLVTYRADGRPLINHIRAVPVQGDLMATQLAQQPWRSPTVFNYYRPGYVAPGTRTAAAGGVAPEFQITTETSVIGYLNFMQTVITSGIGTTPFAGVRDVTSEYSEEIAIADNTDALLDRLDLLLTHGQLSSTSRQKIRDAVNGVSAGTQTGRSNRVKLAIFLIMSSPDYLVLR